MHRCDRAASVAEGNRRSEHSHTVTFIRGAQGSSGELRRAQESSGQPRRAHESSGELRRAQESSR
eukprot:8546190-Alexandrium_andersonii.AAC.1